MSRNAAKIRIQQFIEALPANDRSASFVLQQMLEELDVMQAAIDAGGGGGSGHKAELISSKTEPGTETMFDMIQHNNLQMLQYTNLPFEATLADIDNFRLAVYQDNSEAYQFDIPSSWVKNFFFKELPVASLSGDGATATLVFSEAAPDFSVVAPACTLVPKNFGANWGDNNDFGYGWYISDYTWAADGLSLTTPTTAQHTPLTPADNATMLLMVVELNDSINNLLGAVLSTTVYLKIFG